MANQKIKNQVSASKKKQVNKNSIGQLKQKPLDYSKFFMPSIIIITAIVFANTLGNDFIDNWDDNIYVFDNNVIRHLNWINIKEIFSSFYAGNYQPVAMLSYILDYKFFGLNPFFFHLTNYIFHLLNSMLVYIFIKRFTGKTWVAAITSLFFAIHPMHVESVAWISERKDVFYTFFFLLSLNSYTTYLINGKKIISLIWSFIWFFLSLMSKPAAVCLPLVLVLMDYYYNKKFSLKTLILKIPFFLLALFFGILAVFSQAYIIAVSDVTPLFSIIERVFLVSYSVVYYIFKVFSPFNLSALHFYPIKSGGLLPFEYYLAIPAILLLIWGVYKSGRFKHELIFGLLFYFATIVLVLQIMPAGGAIVSERYSYVPYIGIFFIFGQFFSYIKDKEFSFSSKIKPFISVILVILTIIYSFLTFERNKVWKNGTILFTDVVNKYPEQEFGWWTRGNIKKGKGNFIGALSDYNKAIEINPRYIVAYLNRGNCYSVFDKYDSAIADYNVFINIRTDSSSAYFNRGIAYTKTGKYNSAIDDFNKAAELKPNDMDIYLNRAVAKDGLKDYSGALSDNNKVLQYKPDNPLALFNRGIAKFFLNDKTGACNDWLLAKQYGQVQADAALEKYCK